MEVKATLRFLRMSPRKVRLVADVIRGHDVSRALILLEGMPQHASVPMRKLVRSGMANAENNHQLDPDSLYIKTIMVGEGPTLKRFRPRAFGRSAAIMKRTSHILLLLDQREDATKKESKKDKSLSQESKQEPIEPERKIKTTSDDAKAPKKNVPTTTQSSTSQQS